MRRDECTLCKHFLGHRCTFAHNKWKQPVRQDWWLIERLGDAAAYLEKNDGMPTWREFICDHYDATARAYADGKSYTPANAYVKNHMCKHGIDCRDITCKKAHSSEDQSTAKDNWDCLIACEHCTKEEVEWAKSDLREAREARC